MVTEAEVMAALEGVEAPEGSLAESGRVRALTLREGRVGFAIAVAPGERDRLEPVRASAETRLRSLSGVDEALVALVEEAPPAQGAERQGLAGRAKNLARRVAGRAAEAPAPEPRPAPPAASRSAPASKPASARAPQPKGPLPGVSRIIAVGAGKGGVGKSTVSINLAVSLARLGWRVGLLDADIYGPSVPRLVGAEDHRPTRGGGLQPLETFGIKVMSIGFLVSASQAVVWRGPMATGALGQLLRDSAWGELDALIIDMPPGTGDIQLSLAQTVPLTGAVLVTTPQDLALLDVRKAAEMFAKVHVPILGVVENMAGFICPHCGGHSAIFGEGGGAREAEARGVPLLGHVPLTMAIREASDAGVPVATGEGTEAEAYSQVASNLMARLASVREKPFPRIVFEEA